MSEDVKLCPKCGTPMVQSEFNGANSSNSSFSFDGSTNFDGLKCPKCSAPSEQKETDN